MYLDELRKCHAKFDIFSAKVMKSSGTSTRSLDCQAEICSKELYTCHIDHDETEGMTAAISATSPKHTEHIISRH